MMLSGNGYLTYGFTNGTIVALSEELPTECGATLIPPALVGSTWYVFCGTTVEMWDSITTRKLPPYTLPVGTADISCVALSSDVNHSNASTFVFASATKDNIYAGNAQNGFRSVFTIPDASSSSPCVGATMLPSPGSLLGGNSSSEVVVLTFSGNAMVLALNFRSGVAAALAAGQFAPNGPVVFDSSGVFMFLSSSELPDYLLTPNVLFYGFNLTAAVPVGSPLTPSFASWIPGGQPNVTTAFPFVQNDTTTGELYYIGSTEIFSVAYDGTNRLLGSYNPLSSDYALIVGEFVVIVDQGADQVVSFNTITAKSDVFFCRLPYVANALPMPVVRRTVNGTRRSRVVVFSSSQTIAACLIDLTSRSNVTLASFGANFWRNEFSLVSGAAMMDDDVLLINAGHRHVSAYNLSGDILPRVSMFSISFSDNVSAVISTPLVKFGGLAYFAGVPAPGETNSVYSVSPTGILYFVGATNLAGNFTDSPSTLLIASGGVFGGPVMYLFSLEKVTAIDTDWTVRFQYATNFNEAMLVSPFAVFENTGAVCANSMLGSGNLLVFNGLDGSLAWSYPIQAMPVTASILTDDENLYTLGYNDGVTAFDLIDGNIVSHASMWSGSCPLAAGINTTINTTTTQQQKRTSILIASQGVVYAAPVPSEAHSGNRTSQAKRHFAGKPFPNGTFPGTVIFPLSPANNDGSKAWIAGVVVGCAAVLVGAAVFIHLRRRRRDYDDVPTAPLNVNESVNAV